MLSGGAGEAGGGPIHRVAFEEVSGHRVLLKCGPGNWGLSCWTNTEHLVTAARNWAAK